MFPAHNACIMCVCNARVCVSAYLCPCSTHIAVSSDDDCKVNIFSLLFSCRQGKP